MKSCAKRGSVTSYINMIYHIRVYIFIQRCMRFPQHSTDLCRPHSQLACACINYMHCKCINYTNSNIICHYYRVNDTRFGIHFQFRQALRYGILCWIVCAQHRRNIFATILKQNVLTILPYVHRVIMWEYSLTVLKQRTEYCGNIIVMIFRLAEYVSHLFVSQISLPQRVIKHTKKCKWENLIQF